MTVLSDAGWAQAIGIACLVAFTAPAFREFVLRRQRSSSAHP
jgi:hypothetical protein